MSSRPLTDVQRAEYARICSEGLERLGDDVGAAMREKSFGFLALLTRLRQTCCDPDMLPWRSSPLRDSGKITLLMEKLAEHLPKTAIISVGHRPELEAFHERKVNLIRREGGAKLVPGEVAAPPISVLNTLVKRWRGPSLPSSAEKRAEPAGSTPTTKSAKSAKPAAKKPRRKTAA